MGVLVEEVRVWNTPIFGAYLLWAFTRSYRSNHPEGEAPIGILHFFAYAILMNPRYADRISGKRKDLQSFVRGFNDNREMDLLVGIHDVVKAHRASTMQAIDIAVAQGLLVWDDDTGRIYAHEDIPRAKPGRSLREYTKRLGNKAEVLGKWFSEHDVPTIAGYLKVVL